MHCRRPSRGTPQFGPARDRTLYVSWQYDNNSKSKASVMGDRRRKIAPNGLHTRQKAANGAGNETPSVRNVCVYCGSNSGINPAYTEAARTLGRHMAEAGIGLVYGGGGLGLMGELARTVLAARRPRDRHHSRLPVEEGAHAARCARDDRGRRHASAQEADVRQVGRLRGAARRHRHAGGAGRAADLGATRAPQQADRAGEHRRASGSPSSICSATCAAKSSSGTPWKCASSQ